MSRWLPVVALQAVLAVGVVGAATALSLAIDANAVTAGFVFLVAVLGLAAWRGFLAGTIASLAATAAFNFFFFAPTGSFHIEDRQNWIALGGFLIATTIASRLVVRERARAAESESRQREIEALYELCVDLFTAGARPGGLDAATGRALRKLGAQGGGLILHEDAAQGRAGTSWIGEPRDLEVHRLLRVDPASSSGKGWRNVQVPVTVAGRPAGTFMAYGTRANRETLEAVARLLGLALEREMLLAEQARVEALKASDSLKTALLQAVSHDLSTPLTSILVSVQSVKRALDEGGSAQTPVGVIMTEATRLNRRIRNLLDMARLEAGVARPHREPTPPADLFRAAKDHLPDIVSRRRIDARVTDDCPDLDVDPSLALEILINLVENADRASPAASPIELTASPLATDPRRVVIEVLDRGRGLAETVAPEPPPGAPAGAPPPTGADLPRKGLGLEIACRFAATLQGAVTLEPREGGGMRARVELPASGVAAAGIPEVEVG